MESKPCHTLYFRGFPEEITIDDLNEIFAEFGSIVKCFKTDSYGMVQFEDVSSCNQAIQSLNGQPPLNMYVNMAKSQPSDRNSMKQKNHTPERAPQFDVTYVEEEFYLDENNSVVNFLKDPITNEIYVPISYATNIRRIVKKIPVPVNQLLNNSYKNNANLSDEEDARSDFTNHSSSRKIKPKINDLSITVDVDSTSPKGNRNQNNYQNGEQNNRRPFNNRAGGGSHSSNFEDDKRGRFQRGTPRNDFANKYPISEKGDGNRSENQSGYNKFKPKSEQGNWENNTRSQNNSSRPYNNKFTNKTSNDDKPWNTQSEQKSNYSPSKNESTLSKKFSSPQEKEQPAIKEQKPEVVTPNPSRGAVAKMFSKKSTCKFVELPLNKFTEVKVEHAESESKAWVQICSMLDEFISFMEKVLNYACTDSKPIKPEVGLICLANFDETWFRAIILKSYPKIYVRFIDYGNECEVDGEILELPADMQSVPAFAVCIQLANSGAGKLQNELTLKVKPVKMENDVYEVHLENEKSAQKEYVNPLIASQQNMMSKLKPSMDGLFQYTSKISDTEGIAFFLPNSLDTDILALEKINDAVESLSSVKAQIGDLIVAKHEGWNRAIVLDTTDGFKVGFIDFGVIKTVKEVKPLPKEFHSIPQFTCQFTSKDLSKHVIEAEAMFEITKVEEKRVHCNISSESGNMQISFGLWNPVQKVIKSDSTRDVSTKEPTRNVSTKEPTRDVSTKESTRDASTKEKSPPTIKIKNGDDCKIVAMNPEYFYVKTRETAELMKGVDVAEYAGHAPKLIEEPHVGQYVAAQFNGSWYRAIVTKVTNNAANVLFIDYGNEEVKPFFSLKLLDEYCVEIPHTIIKIKLRGFVDKKLSPKCMEYLEQFQNKILKASFNGNPDNGVDLITKEGKNLNDELSKLSSQGSAMPPLRKEPYMNVRVPGNEDIRISDFEIEPIPFGETEVQFLGIIALKKYVIAICPNNSETLHKIQVDLVSQITKYANLVAPKLPYCPEINEVVLVSHSGKWYRGFTIGTTESDGFEIYLLDYGFEITVTSTELRKMPAEFMDTHKTLASFAVIKGLPPKPSKKLTDRIVDYFNKNEVYKVNVIGVQDYESQTYEVLFPCFLKQLKEDNIL